MTVKNALSGAESRDTINKAIKLSYVEAHKSTVH